MIAKERMRLPETNMNQRELERIILDLRDLKDKLFNGDNIGELRNAIEILEKIQLFDKD